MTLPTRNSTVASSPTTTLQRAGFILDLDRCTGCSACGFACRIENDLPPGCSFRQVTTFNPTHEPDLPVLHLSLACNHCDHPACMAACPTAAYVQDPLTGAVVLHQERCMGCTYCAWVCPYGAPQFDGQRGVMTKCTFCASRVERGLLPACVIACPVDALHVLDDGRAQAHVPHDAHASARVLGHGRAAAQALHDDLGADRALGHGPAAAQALDDDLGADRALGHGPAAAQALHDGQAAPHRLGVPRAALDPACVPGFPDTGLGPAIQLLSRRRVPPWRRRKTSHVPALQWSRLRAEWPLAVFTFVTTLVVSWFLGALLGGPRPDPAFFLLLAGLGGFVSTRHLGRPARMGRALRHLRTSWVSREIALFMTFLLGAATFFLVAQPKALLAWTTAALGLATLGAMDLVYRVPGQAGRAVPHSAMTSLTALFLAGCFAGQPWLAAPTAAAKLLLYVARHGRHQRAFSGKRLALHAARMLLGFAVPAAAWLALGTPLPHAAVAAALLGEALDRLEFYAALEFLNPRRQADLDAAALSQF